MSDLEFHYEGRNYVVVGASSGMGRRIALDLAGSGAKVLAVARNEERLSEVKVSFPERITTASLDVLKADDKAWEAVLAPFVDANGKCNGAVYTAGIVGGTPLRSYNDQFARQIVDTSLWGMIRFLHMISKKKYANKGSSYVVFSSVAAYCGNKGEMAYAAAKGAVQSAVRSVAKEICRDMHRINSVSPGWVETDMTKIYQREMGEIQSHESLDGGILGTGKPEDVSGAVLFLLSDAARWITGTDIVIDGGSLLGTH